MENGKWNTAFHSSVHFPFTICHFPCLGHLPFSIRVVTSHAMNVPLLDLQAQYLPIRNEIRHAIDEVCDSQQLILGPHVERFEKSLAGYCQTKHAIGVSSGTDALLCS